MQPNEQFPMPTSKSSLAQLETWLRSETAAEETYEAALASVAHTGLHRALQELMASHARRKDQIRLRIVELGGEPQNGSGAWGAFTKAMQAGADLFGEGVAIAALEEGEDHCLKLYEQGIDRCDPATRRIAELMLLPEERRTHELCRALKSYAKNPT
jgi:hypothetical protein